jgi:ArsR family transcriptional regulator
MNAKRNLINLVHDLVRVPNVGLSSPSTDVDVDAAYCAGDGDDACGAPDGEVDDDLCVPSITDAPLAEDDAVELARVLSALADPVRLRLLSLVSAHHEICSCDLERPLRRSQPTISHHTKVLVEAGLLVGERRGRWTWWRIAPDTLTAVRVALGG